MAINLASKYSSKIAEKFTKESFIGSDVNSSYDWSGVDTINIYTPVTVAAGNYDRTNVSSSTGAFARFGATTEMQDTIQTLKLTQDKGFSVSIDKGNLKEQMEVKKPMEMLGLQIREQITPMVDKYALSKWAESAGTKATITEPTDGNELVDEILIGCAELDNNLVPSDSRVCYIGRTLSTLLVTAGYVNALEKIGTPALERGYIGNILGLKIKWVPDSYLPENTKFLITYKDSVLLPKTISTARVLTEVPGLDGALLEGRYRYDAFVLAAKNKGVYAASITG